MRHLLLRLYPRAWRQRYGAEMTDMLEHTPLSVRIVTDLIAGAIDAKLNPHLLPAVGESSQGGTMKA